MTGGDISWPETKTMPVVVGSECTRTRSLSVPVNLQQRGTKTEKLRDGVTERKEKKTYPRLWVISRATKREIYQETRFFFTKPRSFSSLPRELK